MNFVISVLRYFLGVVEAVDNTCHTQQVIVSRDLHLRNLVSNKFGKISG